MIKLCLLSANLVSHSWCKEAGPQPVLSRWWWFVFVLRLQMDKGVALVGAGEKTSTLSPLFCSGKILNPQVFLMSTSLQDLFPKDLFSLGELIRKEQTRSFEGEQGAISRRLGLRRPQVLLPPGKNAGNPGWGPAGTCPALMFFRTETTYKASWFHFTMCMLNYVLFHTQSLYKLVVKESLK